MRPSARQNTRSGSAIILIAAFLVVMAVLSFGFLAYVMDQRGAARNSQIQGLLHHALTSGRDHAKFLLDHQAAQNGSGTGLTGTWATAFAALPGYPSADSEPDPTLRRTQRLTLVAAVNPGEWGDANAVDLFRNIPGLASPADQTQWNGHDRGNTVHDGTARWLPLGFFDRSLRRTSDPA
ncbi:MAG: hypothetical protein RLZZ127_1064, partial [Planctomycetota bacterium]